MSMTVIVTRNVSPRVRGFLASVLLEMAPGVYSAPRLSPAVRIRIWDILEAWFPNETDASIVMLWQSHDMPGGQDAMMLGTPPIKLVEVDGILLARREIPESTLVANVKNAH